MGGASVDSVDANGWSPLMHAAHRRCFKSVAILLELGASTLARDSDGRTALAYASHNGDLEIARVLIDFHPAAARHGDEAAGIALFCAVLQDHAEMVRRLLRTAIPPPMKGTAMRLALEHGHHEIVETLARQASV